MLSALDHEWRSAVQLADIAKVSRNAANKLMMSVTEADNCEVKEEHWIDHRKRHRKRRLYRRPVNTKAEMVALYNNLFAPKIPVGLKPTVVHRLKK